MKCRSFKYDEILKRKLPFLTWYPKYDGQTALADLVAGITVGLTLIPQSIAYASLAGLPPQYGLYSAVSGGFVYAIFGSIPEISIAPTALLSLLTYNYTNKLGLQFSILLCFLAGCLELFAGLLNLGFLVEFVSVPVVSGFTSAAAVTIASTQVKNLLGLKIKSDDFIDTWINIFKNIKDTRKWDVYLSIGCCFLLIGLKHLKDFFFCLNDGLLNKTLNKVLWLISLSRNAIVVIFSAVLVASLNSQGTAPFTLTEKVEAGFPNITLPPFSTEANNQTYTFKEMSVKLGTGIIIVPLVAILSNIAIAKAFAHGKILDANQEMFTLGLCNIIGSFFGSMPVNGSFSRSAVNNTSGVKTPLGGLYTAILVILSLCFLTPYFSYIPKATLSSVIICAVIFMIEIKILKILWKTNKCNLLSYIVTFFACLLLGIELGILVGITLDMLFMLYFCARPKLEVQKMQLPEISDKAECSIVKLEGAIFYPAVEHVRRKLTRIGQSTNTVAIDCSLITKLDYTAAQGIGATISSLKNIGCNVIFIGLTSEIATILGKFCKDNCKYANTHNDIYDLCIDPDKILFEKTNSFETASLKEMKKDENDDDVKAENSKL